MGPLPVRPRFGASPTLRGFYLQDGGDGDPATSDGVFVFDSGANLVAAGDVVQVTGQVGEFQGQTQITAGATADGQVIGVIGEPTLPFFATLGYTAVVAFLALAVSFVVGAPSRTDPRRNPATSD